MSGGGGGGGSENKRKKIFLVLRFGPVCDKLAKLARRHTDKSGAPF
jgi:hypothetical protein